MAIEDWMPELAEHLAQIPGIKQVHTYADLPATIMAFPTLIILPRGGTQTISAGGVNLAHHEVQLTLYVAGQVLPEGYSVAVPFIKKIRDQLAKSVTLGGLVEHVLPVSPPERFYSGPGSITYGDKSLFGILFLIDVKEHEAVTVSA